MYIFDRDDQLVLAAKCSLMISLLPKGTLASRYPVVSVGEPALDQPHDPADCQPWRYRDNEMNVIRHDDKGEELEAPLVPDFTNDLKQELYGWCRAEQFAASVDVRRDEGREAVAVESSPDAHACDGMTGTPEPQVLFGTQTVSG